MLQEKHGGREREGQKGAERMWEEKMAKNLATLMEVLKFEKLHNYN